MKNLSIISLCLLLGFAPSIVKAAALTDEDLVIAQVATDLTTPGSGNPTSSACLSSCKPANIFDDVVGTGNTGRWISTQNSYATSPYVYATYTFDTATIVDAYSVQILDGKNGAFAVLGRAPKTMHFYGTNDSLDSETVTWTLLDITDGGETATTWTKASEIQYFRANADRVAYTTYKWECTAPQDASEGGSSGLTNGGQGYIQISELQFLSAFAEDVTVYVVTANESTGGTVTLENTNVVAGNSITITATPDTENNYVFTRWDVTNGTIADETAAETTFTPTASDATVTAVFTKTDSLITVQATEGGTATASATTVAPGDSVTLTATPAEGYSFYGWVVSGGTVADVTSTETSYTPNANDSVTAIFLPLGDETITLYVDPTNGSDDYSGYTEATAKGTLEGALNLMTSAFEKINQNSKGRIYLLPGTYKKTGTDFVIPYDIQILGSTGNPDDVVIEYAYETNWHANHTTFTLEHENALVANLTLYKGYGHSQPYKPTEVDITSGVLSNCVIKAARLLHHYRKSNVWLRGEKARVTRCLFLENTLPASCGWDGPFAYISGSSIYMQKGLVDNCVFKNNYSEAVTSNTPIATTVHMEGGTLVNCSLFENNASLCGGVNVSSTSARVINTVLYKNVITEGTLAHDGHQYNNYRAGDGTAKYEACFVNCAADEEVMVGTNGIANLTETAFIDYANGDYRPAGGMCLINAGTHEDVPEEALRIDFAGNPRVVNRVVDIGAFEQTVSGTIIVIH